MSLTKIEVSGTSEKLSKSGTSAELRPLFMRIAVEDIVYLKSILESYEDLGIIRTLNRARGEVVILSVHDFFAELLLLLEALRPAVRFEITEPPSGMSEDWLLAEEVL